MNSSFGLSSFPCILSQKYIWFPFKQSIIEFTNKIKLWYFVDLADHKYKKLNIKGAFLIIILYQKSFTKNHGIEFEIYERKKINNGRESIY